MGIYKRGSVWWMRVSCQGNQIRRSTETTDRKLAQRIHDKVVGAIAEEKWFARLPGEDYTLGDMMKKYLSEYSLVMKAPRTYERDRSLAGHLLESFKDRPLLEISAREISEYKLKRRTAGAAPRTIQYELGLMSHAYKIAIKDWEWVTENPVSKVSRDPVRNKIERWLSDEEEKQLLLASPAWLREIVIFAIHTGFRMSEILDLKWHQVDLERRVVTISEQKNGRVDTLPLDKTIVVLLQCKKGKASGQLVFSTKKGTRILNRNLFRAFRNACMRARIERFRFHDLRHTFATRLVQSGVDLYKVQKLGRWRTLSMVDRYAHHWPESLRSGIEVMDRLKDHALERKPSTNLAQSEKKRGHAPYLRLVTP